jgi:hypothetical protein
MRLQDNNLLMDVGTQLPEKTKIFEKTPTRRDAAKTRHFNARGN